MTTKASFNKAVRGKRLGCGEEGIAMLVIVELAIFLVVMFVAIATGLLPV